LNEETQQAFFVRLIEKEVGREGKSEVYTPKKTRKSESRVRTFRHAEFL